VLCDHGLYPVPAPATLEMMRGLPIAQTAYKLEMTTPTGAGIVSGIVDHFSVSLPPMVIESIGYGAGTRDLPNQPNVLRVVVGKTEVLAVDWQVQPEHLQVQDHQLHEHHHHSHSVEHEHEHGNEHRHEHEHGHEHGHEHEHGHSHAPNLKKHTHTQKNDEPQSEQQGFCN
jgi:pyridinium-3,5-bisthiocarboxylic acid mononucleotide nickel chelatase